MSEPELPGRRHSGAAGPKFVALNSYCGLVIFGTHHASGGDEFEGASSIETSRPIHGYFQHSTDG